MTSTNNHHETLPGALRVMSFFFFYFFAEDFAGLKAEDKEQESVCELAATNTGSSNPADCKAEAAESNSSSTGVASSSGRKWKFNRQFSRTKEMSCSRPVQDLKEHKIFISIQENQFRRNGMGNFGTFFY